MSKKSPRFIKPYPRKTETGIRWFKKSTIQPEKTRQPRPRIHGRPWKFKTRQDRLLELEERAAAVQGSLQERIFYAALVKWGLQPGADFTFQPSMLGGRAELGGLVADFMFEAIKLIVQVQSYWHTITLYFERRDQDQAMIMQDMGYLVLEIWPEDIEDPKALDDWIANNIIPLWGTNSLGQGAGAVPGSVTYLNTIEQDLLLKIERQCDAILEVI